VWKAATHQKDPAMKFRFVVLVAALSTSLFACAANAPAPSPAGKTQDQSGDSVQADCTAAGGKCVAVVPGACQTGSTLAGACGDGVGVMCCIPGANSCKPLAGTSSSGGVGLANPASVYCTQMGYVLNGAQCEISASVTCEQWAFYRGECGQAQSFCARQGGSVQNVTEARASATVSFAKCTLPGGASCEEQAFATSCQCKQ
jgi:putative hemolysin